MSWEQLSLFEQDDRITDEEIWQIVGRGSGMEGGRRRIREHFESTAPSAEDASFLQNEYGIGGAWPAFAAERDKELALDYNGQGLLIRRIANLKEEVRLPWNRVAKMVREMVEAGEY